MDEATPRRWPWRIAMLTLMVVTLAAIVLVVIARYRASGVMYSVISPDGRFLAVSYTDHELRKTQLRVINADQPGAPRFKKTLRRDADFRGDADFRWSPDSRHLLLVEAGAIALFSADTNEITPLPASGLRRLRTPNEGQTHRWLTGDRLAYQDTAYAWHIIDGQMQELGRLDTSVVSITHVSDTRLICLTLSGAVLVYTHTGTLVTRLDSLYTLQWQNAPGESFIGSEPPPRGYVLQADTIAFIEHRPDETHSGYALVAGRDSSTFGVVAAVDSNTALIGRFSAPDEWVLLDRDTRRVVAISAADGTSRVVSDLTAYGSPEWLWHGVVNSGYVELLGRDKDGTLQQHLIIDTTGKVVKSILMGLRELPVSFSHDGRYLASLKFTSESSLPGVVGYLFSGGSARLTVVDLVSSRTFDAQPGSSSWWSSETWSNDGRLVFVTDTGWFTRPLLSVFNASSWQVVSKQDVFADQDPLRWPAIPAVAVMLAVLLTLGFGFTTVWRGSDGTPQRVFGLTAVAVAWVLLPVLPAVWDSGKAMNFGSIPIVGVGIGAAKVLLPVFLLCLWPIVPGGVRFMDLVWEAIPRAKQMLHGSVLLPFLPAALYLLFVMLFLLAAFSWFSPLLAALLAGSGLLLTGYRRTASQDARRRIAVLGQGTGVALMGSLVLFLMPPARIYGDPMPIAELVAILSLLAIPPCGAYALRRDRVRDSATPLAAMQGKET